MDISVLEFRTRSTNYCVSLNMTIVTWSLAQQNL